MSIGIMVERPPYIRFEMRTQEYRDNAGVSHARDVEMVLVTPAGSKDVHEAIADEWIAHRERQAQMNPPQFNPDWAQRFRASFELWRKGHEIPEYGTPIRTWPALLPSETKRCIDANVLTVEDLASINEAGLARLGMGSRALKAKAVVWLEDKDKSKSSEQLVAAQLTIDELRSRVDDQDATIRSMAEKIAENTSAKRGRRAAQEPPQLDDGGDAIRMGAN